MWGIDMGRELKKHPYVLYYNDATFQTIDLLTSDVKKIETAMVKGERFAAISIGILWLTEFRSLLERIDPPVVVEEKKEEPVYPGMSLEDEAYLNELIAKERAANKKEVDYQ
jgi:hypothetical protein